MTLTHVSRMYRTVLLSSLLVACSVEKAEELPEKEDNDAIPQDPFPLVQLSSSAAPEARAAHTAVWSGERMYLFGGEDAAGNLLGNGASFDPHNDTWVDISTALAPRGRKFHTMVDTAEGIIVWGGISVDEKGNSVAKNTGGIYHPASGGWTPIDSGYAPSPRYNHAGVSTGDKMVIWGGHADNELGDGAVYNPFKDSWLPMSEQGAPSARSGHTMVWSGQLAIVWGGRSNDFSASGARYDPTTNSWQAISPQNGPSARTNHAATWTDKGMLVWGGHDNKAAEERWLNTGAIYDPIQDVWLPISDDGAPSGRAGHTMISTGRFVIIYGGHNAAPLASGAIYDTMHDRWASIRNLSRHEPRTLHTAVWTGEQMISWGGFSKNGRHLKAGIKLRLDEKLLPQ